MKWRLSDQAQAILITFMVDGQFVVPDSASLKLTVRGNDGAILPGYNQVAQADVLVTQVELNLPADINLLANGAEFESRYVRLEFKSGGVPHYVDYAYRLYEFVPLNLSPNYIRSLVGADYEELPDGDVDLVGSYYNLLSTFGDNLKTALTLTTVVSMYANEAIGLQCAVDLCPSLPSRILKGDKQDNAGFTRHDVDFKKLEVDLRAKLADKLGLITKAITGTTAAFSPHTLFAVANQTDRLTGSDS